MAGVRPQWPLSFAQLFTQVREGSMSGSVILLVFGGAIIIIAFISFMELAQRRVLVQYPKRATQRGMQADRSHLPLKVNTSGVIRSEEHTSELQSLMRISYAVFCLKKKNKRTNSNTNVQT